MVRILLRAALACCALAGMPAAAAEVVVDGTEVTAERSGDSTTAKVEFLNTGDVTATLSGMTVSPQCAVTPASITLPARQSTVVTLTLQEGCPTDEAVVVDADGPANPLPPITVKPPEDAAPGLFSHLVPGGLAGLVLAGATLVMVDRQRKKVAETLTSTEATAARLAAHDQLVADITQACALASVVPAPDKMPSAPEPPDTSWKAPLTGLEASWSFADSWLGNANIAAAGVVTLLSTTDLLEVVFDEVPEGLTAGIAMAAGVGLLLVALGNATLRAIGTQTKVPTVLGFALAAALAVLATTLNVVTLAAEVSKDENDLGLGGGKALVIWAFAAGALCLMLKYVWTSAHELLSDGLQPAPPTVPEAVRAAWVIAAAVQPDEPTARLSPLEISMYAAQYGEGGASYPVPPLGWTSPGDDRGRATSAML